MRAYQWAVLAASVVGLACHVFAREQAVALGKLPPVVVETVKKLFPDAKLQRATSHQEKDGDVEYMILAQENGKRIEITIEADGEIEEFAKEIDLADLPKPVTAALEGTYPQAVRKSAEAVFEMDDGQQKLESYQVQLVTSGRQTINVKVKTDTLVVTQRVDRQEPNPQPSDTLDRPSSETIRRLE